MRIARIALLLALTMLLLFVMTGCRCVPSSEDWYFFSYKEDMVFMNGVTLNLGFSDASHAFPFSGSECENIGISFSKDGKVAFTPKDGITRYGTHTYEHEGLSYTDFTITLENGEIIEGSSMNSSEGKKLALTYQGIVYNFTTENKRTGTTIDDVIAEMLNGNFGSLNEAQVCRNGEGYAVRFSDMIYYPIEETTAVFAVTVHTDGSYEIMDELHEGNVFSTYTKDTDYIVIYYLIP